MYNARVQAFDNEGKFLWFYKIKNVLIPDEITIDKKGNIVVIDADRKNINVIDSSGKHSKVLLTLQECKLLKFAGIIAADTSNNYIFADAYTPYIWKIDATGNVENLHLDFLKKEQIAISDLTIDKSDNLWVVDEEKFAVLKINPEGKIHSLKHNEIGNILKDLAYKWTRIRQLQRIYLFLIITLVLMSLVLLFYKGK